MSVRSLTARLSLGVVLLVLLSVGLMAGLAVWRSAEALRERALATNHTVALGVSYAVEQYVADAVAIMREAAERPKLRHEIINGNWPEARTVLENVARHFQQFDYVFVQDAQGIIRARVPHAETVGEDFSSRDFFREAMQTRQPYLSGVYVSKAAQRPVVASRRARPPCRWTCGRGIGRGALPPDDEASRVGRSARRWARHLSGR